MTSTAVRVARSASVVGACALSACAALTPNRSVQSTMTLAPGQTVTGRFSNPGDGDCFVQLQRQAPRKGVPPYPESTTWTGDDKVRITFPDDPAAASEQPLGYASDRLRGGGACRVVVRNMSTEPATFDWIVTGPADAVADWDVSAPAAQ